MLNELSFETLKFEETGFSVIEDFGRKTFTSVPAFSSALVNVFLKLKSNINLLFLDNAVRSDLFEEAVCFLRTNNPVIHCMMFGVRSFMYVKTTSKHIVQFIYDNFVRHIYTATNRVNWAFLVSPKILLDSYTAFSIKKTCDIFVRYYIHFVTSLSDIISGEVSIVKSSLAYFANWANSVNTPILGKTERSSFTENVQRLYTQPERDKIVRTDMKVSEPCRNDRALSIERLTDCNLKYLKLMVHQERDMAIRDFISPENQDGLFGRIYWAGNLICSNLARQGLLTGTIDS